MPEELSREEQKSAHEREVFAQFAATARLVVRPDSITSQRPPHPDVLCEIDGRGPVAFELIRLVDESWAAGIALMVTTRERVRTYFDALEGPQGDAFRGKFRSAMIGLQFADGAPLRDRLAALPGLVSDLMAHEGEGSDPEIDLSTRTQHVIERAAIYRGRFSGPVVDVSHASMIGDPTLDLLREKLRRTDYDVTHPMELLAYTDGIDLLLPYDLWLPKFEGIIRELVDGSAFSRVWVYHASSDPRMRSVKLTVP